MRLKILFLITILLSVNAHAQKKNPPSRRVIIEALEPTEVLKKDGFKIDFPAAPQRSVATIETGYGKTDMVSLRLATNVAFYSVNYLDFPTVLTDQAEINLRFDAVKAALINEPDARLISETKISFGGSPGVEIVVEGKDSTLTMRCLIIHQRFFQLIVATKGKQSKSTERVKNFNRKNVEAFINSFSVTELPTPKLAAVKLPNDFGIEMNSSMFTSRFFGLSIKKPEGWRVVEKEQTDIIKDLSVQEVEGSSEKVQKTLDLSLKNTEILLFMTKSDIATSVNTSVFAIAAEQVSFPNFEPKAVADVFLSTFVQADERVLKKPTSIKIGGINFVWVEVENLEKKYKKRMYIANRKGIALELVMIYTDESELNTMLDSLATIKFSEVVEK